MTPAQVRARLAKRAKNCASLATVAAGVNNACPGWRIAILANGRDVRLRACEECNALAPSRLRVTDEHVRLLPEATQALAQARAALRREREARRTTTHLRTDPFDNTTLCGRRTGRTERGRRQHGWTYFAERVDCERCLRLHRMTPAERAALDAEKGAKLSSLRGKKDQERAAKRAELVARVEEARPEAMVLLDAIEAGKVSDAINYEREWTEERRLLEVKLDELLALAVLAHKIDNPTTRGERLWKYSAESTSADERVRDTLCRFCGEVMEESVKIGDRGVEAYAKHTQPCALRYLAGDFAPRPHPEVSPGDHTVSGSSRAEDVQAS